MTNNRRSGFKIMASLAHLLKPLAGHMAAAVAAGVVGFILAFGLGVIGVYAILAALGYDMTGLAFGGFSPVVYLVALAIAALLRGPLHYLEQFFNHLIAFKVLALIRAQVFAAMRKLAPAKIESKNPGQLISIIMGDIELLEVFYAHTVSPILIGASTTVILAVFYINLHPMLVLVPLASQVFIGIVIPLVAAKKGNKVSVDIRESIADLNGDLLDNLKGVEEVIQYGTEQPTLNKLDLLTSTLLSKQKILRSQLGTLTSWVDGAVMVFASLQVLVATYLVANQVVTPAVAIVGGMLTISSFGPYINLANLGNTLTRTFACGERVLSLLEEKPQVTPKTDGINSEGGRISMENITFKYPGTDSKVLDGFTLNVDQGETLGIMGDSGQGKSTGLKLMLRFWDPDEGTVSLGGENIKNINTSSLYDNISYMTQTTVLFTGTIRDNLLVAKKDASEEEMYQALKKASLYEYVNSLPKKLDERVGEDGANFSGGERQRMGLARCFLANRQILLLDEPTSNLDSINEAVILRSLSLNKEDHTVIMVSHRESTLGICNRIININDRRSGYDN